MGGEAVGAPTYLPVLERPLKGGVEQLLHGGCTPGGEARVADEKIGLGFIPWGRAVLRRSLAA